MRKLIKILLALAFCLLLCGAVEGQSVYGVKKLKKLGQIGQLNDSDSLLIYKHVRIIGGTKFSGAIVISGGISYNTSLTVTGIQDGDAALILDADESDDNVDKWSIISQASGNDLSFVNHTTEVMNLTSTGDLQVDGSLTAATISVDNITPIALSGSGVTLNISTEERMQFLSTTDMDENSVFAFASSNAIFEMVSSSGEQAWLNALVRADQSGTANYVGFLINIMEEDATATGQDYFLDMRLLGVSNFAFETDGDMFLRAGDAEIYDIGDLASESLADITNFGTGNWSYTGEIVADGTDATFTWASSGVGTMTQTSGNMTIAGVGSRWYKLAYTITNSTVAGETVTITTAFAASATELDVSSAATYTVYFKSAASPANFVISITGAGSGAFTITEISLKEVNGGDLSVHGTISVGANAIVLTGSAMPQMVFTNSSAESGTIEMTGAAIIMQSSDEDVWLQSDQVNGSIRLKTNEDKIGAALVYIEFNSTGDEFTSGSIEQSALIINARYDQTSTAGAVDLLVDRLENTVGSGTDLLMDLRLIGTPKFSVSPAGDVTATGTIAMVGLNQPGVTVTNTSSYAVLAANTGKRHIIGDFGQVCTITLPAEAAGLNYEFWYYGANPETHDHIILTNGGNAKNFKGGVVFLDVANAISDVSGNGSTNSKLTINNMSGGSFIKMFCDGTNWFVTGTVVSDVAPAWADQ